MGPHPVSPKGEDLKENHPRGGGWLIDDQYSLRQYDLDQVVRVERFTLLSARAFTGTPFSCVTIVILY